MSDAKLRELERRWRETKSVEDEAAYLRERVRVGDLCESSLRMAAFLGQAAAALVHDLPSDHASRIRRFKRVADVQQWLTKTVAAEAAAVAYQVALEVIEQYYGEVGQVAASIPRLVSRWTCDPSSATPDLNVAYLSLVFPLEPRNSNRVQGALTDQASRILRGLLGEGGGDGTSDLAQALANCSSILLVTPREGPMASRFVEEFGRPKPRASGLAGESKRGTEMVREYEARILEKIDREVALPLLRHPGYESR